MTISDFSDGVTVGSEVGDADANTPYVTLDDVAIYKHDLVLILTTYFYFKTESKNGVEKFVPKIYFLQ